MQYSIVFVGSLAAFATTTLAAPFNSRQVNGTAGAFAATENGGQGNAGDVTTLSATGNGGQGNAGDVTIVLQNSAQGNPTELKDDGVPVPARVNGEPVKQITVQPGQGASDELRCQAIGQDDEPLAAQRGDNIDINFSKGEPWIFLQGEVDVKELVCDEDFKKITAEELEQGQKTRVILRTEAGASLEDKEKALSVAFTAQGASTTFSILDEEILGRQFATVEIEEGKLNAPQGLRCSVQNDKGADIEAVRGENRDVTFGDGDKGEWTFLAPESETGDGEAGNGQNGDATAGAAGEGDADMSMATEAEAARAAAADDMEKRQDLTVPEMPQQAPSLVSGITCSPKFVKGEGEGDVATTE